MTGFIILPWYGWAIAVWTVVLVFGTFFVGPSSWWATRQARRRNPPSTGYPVQAPQPPSKALGVAMTDLSATLAWGSPSIGTWRRRCEQSLERSRARRQRSKK